MSLLPRTSPAANPRGDVGTSPSPAPGVVHTMETRSLQTSLPLGIATHGRKAADLL